MEPESPALTAAVRTTIGIVCELLHRSARRAREREELAIARQLALEQEARKRAVMMSAILLEFFDTPI